MSWLDDLYASVGAHPGSWKVLGVPLPDFSKTEKFQKTFFPKQVMASSGGSDLWLDKEGQQKQAEKNANLYPSDYKVGSYKTSNTPIGPPYDPSLAVKKTDTNTRTTNDSSGGSSGGDGGSGGGTGETEEEARQRFIQEQMDLARAKWEGGVKTARSKAENAKKYRDEMKGIIGNKRGEFEKMFQEALGQIGVGASQRIGETGRMAQDMETAAGNRARALGLTGTTAMQMLNRPNDAHARDVFNISQQKTANENENRRLLGERQDWATGKESDLDQYYQNIADEAANLENMAYLNYWNDLSGLGNQIDSYLQSMINTQNQMALMNPQLTGYQASALTPSFQNTMASLQGLSNGLNTKQMPQETDEATSLVAENPYLKLLRNARA